MANSVTDIRKHIFAETDIIVLDANIWLFLYGPGEPTDRRTAMYSQAFVQILNSGCRIHLDALVLSEVINRLARFEHELLMESGAQVPTDFKQFRDSPQFSAVALDISVTAKKLVNYTKQVETNFSGVPLVEMLDEFGKGSKDFNDQLLAELCKSKNYTLVTDDGDFAVPGLKVITGNARLLKS
jgi:predicted nucleic acid-binding protein